MRNAWRTKVVVLLASVVITAGCSTTQPDRVTGRTASLTITGKGKVELYDCFDKWQDTAEPFGTIDANDTYIEKACQDAFQQSQTDVPWRYSLNISVIPAGTTAEIVAVSSTGVFGSSIQPQDGIDDFLSMTAYDLGATPLPPRSEGTFYFINGKQVSAGSPIYQESLGIYLGESGILGPNPSFDFAVNSGDTVVVRARKQYVADAPQYIPPSPDPELQIAGLLAIEGVTVATMGTSLSTIADGAGFAFSFTVR